MKNTIEFILKWDMRTREVVLKIGTAIESPGELVGNADP